MHQFSILVFEFYVVVISPFMSLVSTIIFGSHDSLGVLRVPDAGVLETVVCSISSGRELTYPLTH